MSIKVDIINLRNDIELLEECIEDKWLPICLGDKSGTGCSDCVLCKVYTLQPADDSCTGCPIVEDRELKCYQGSKTYPRLWWVGAENWWVQSEKQQAYEMLFYLHDLREHLKEELDSLKDKEKELNDE